MKSKDEVIRQLVATGRWGKSEVAARRGYRANFHCEYCGRDLLSSVDNYKAWNEEHIIPKKSGGKENDDNNIAVACDTCNRLKGRWNPSLVCGPKASREELIKAAREYIESKRTGALQEIVDFRRIIYSSSNDTCESAN